MAYTPEQALHASIFHPHILKRLHQIQQDGTRFVHYSSAEAALAILSGESIWMRQVSCMNDVQEVEHGLRCLRSAYRTAHGSRLKAALNSMYPGITDEIEKSFNDGLDQLRYSTFLTCLSEHGGDGKKEDQLGRLSMWRAYGGTTGVALVVKQAPFVSTSTALGAFSSPVAYLDDEELADELGELANGIEGNREFLEKAGKDYTARAVLTAFQFAAICTKHPGFKEEREWRVISTPAFGPPKNLTRSIKIIRGVPQPVLSIKLQDIPDEGLVGLNPADFLDRVIIGPTEFWNPVYEAFWDELYRLKVPDIASKLVISGIPLRM